jgi:hypothetical protein
VNFWKTVDIMLIYNKGKMNLSTIEKLMKDLDAIEKEKIEFAGMRGV